MSTGGYLPVHGGHRIYYETHGDPSAPPLIVLHGGPGGGMQPELLPLFAGWYTIMYDQRGCGRSQPFGELHCNRTPDLVADIEALRTSLGVKRWTVYGGSWGTTLALAYVLEHPDAVRALIFRGTCLCEESTFRWMYERGGAAEIYPDAWAKFVKDVPQRIQGAGWKALVQWYHDRIRRGGAVGRKAAEAWWRWEWSLSRLIPGTKDAGGAMAIALLETHYFLHGCWLPHLIRDLRRKRTALRRIPLTMVHGRYDLVCPLSGVETLKQVMPHARLVIVPEAGHSTADMMPEVRREIRRMRLIVTRATRARRGTRASKRVSNGTVKRRASK